MRKDGFILRESQGILYYSCRAFESLPHVRHGFSTRRGGASGECSFDLGSLFLNSPERINENRRRFLSVLHLEDARLITLRQVHSNHVCIIEDISGPGEPIKGDALAAGIADAALAVQIADCLPVLIADPVNHAIAAVHSGWKGTLSRILLQTIFEMQRAFGSNPAQLLIAVGPGIRACCFEVGTEVAILFKEAYPGVRLAMPLPACPGKYLLDLCKALDVQLDLAGIPQENRHDLNACTRCKTGEFFSYRAEGQAAGRMMAVIGISSRRLSGSI
jgi:polyphenol oxidase